MSSYIRPFDQLGMHDVQVVGGKNASIGELIRHLSGLDVRVPQGFATTAEAYREFLAQGGLDARIAAALDGLDVDDLERLAHTGAQIRAWILATPFPGPLQQEVLAAWKKMQTDGEIAVAVRSSATAEDLPEASFAG
ncbi:MAG TPA: PEP/pyruvate-binding domain-containing protein, partial [Steroidobacteraceae bacterium]|nr:PEP/pyruvate-binding domain-containing protein [Steroidobacteraceae bacterium]